LNIGECTTTSNWTLRLSLLLLLCCMAVNIRIPQFIDRVRLIIIRDAFVACRSPISPFTWLCCLACVHVRVVAVLWFEPCVFFSPLWLGLNYNFHRLGLGDDLFHVGMLLFTGWLAIWLNSSDVAANIQFLFLAFFLSKGIRGDKTWCLAGLQFKNDCVHTIDWATLCA